VSGQIPFRRPDPSRRLPAWVTALVLAAAAAGLTLAVLLAARAGPLEAHPPTVQPQVPTAPPRSAGTPPPLPSMQPQQTQTDTDWLWWVAAVLGGLLVLLLVIWLIRALRRPGRIVAVPGGTATPPGSPVSLDWLDERAPVDLTDDRTFDPLRAADDIIACWTAVEAAAASAGRPRGSASTPTEFLQRLTERWGDAPAAPISSSGGDGILGPPPVAGWSASTVLLRLYHRARFDTAALAPGAATAARSAARALLARIPWQAGSSGVDRHPPDGPVDAAARRGGEHR